MAQNPLAKSCWKLIVFLTGDSEEPPIEGTELTACFTSTSLSGSGGCNIFGTDYLLKLPEQINISGLFHTEKFCSEPPGIMEQETRYFETLLGANRFQLGGGLGPLTLVSDETGLGLRFERLE